MHNRHMLYHTAEAGPQFLKGNLLKLSSAGIVSFIFRDHSQSLGGQRKYSLSRNSLTLTMEETLN